MTLLDAALAYAARGWHVFPCIPNTKNPMTSRGFYDASIDPVVIRKWWTETPNANVALWTGTTSGVFAVDVDDPAHPIIGRLPATLCSRTPRGGSHFLYALSEPLPGTVGGNKDDSKNKLGYKVDARGDGGYLLLSPSVVDGKPYTWVDASAELAPVPEFILTAMRPKPVERVPYVPSSVTGHGTSAWGQKAMDGVLQELSSAQEGARNATLNRCAFRLAQAVAGGHIEEWEARNALLDAAIGIGLTDKESKKTINSGFKGGLCSPRGPEKRADPLNGALIICETAEEIPPPPKSLSTVIVEQDKDASMWALLNDVHSLGGICETFPQWVMDGAEYRQPGLTLGALLALGAVMAGRRFVYEGMTSSLYVCAIAPTAEGKGRPQGCLSRILSEQWSTTLGPSDFSSSASTVDLIKRTTDKGTGLLCVVDEYGARLKTFMDPRVGGHQKEMRSLLLHLGTIGTQTYSAAMSLARGGEAKNITAPSLSLFGSSTPQALHETIGRMAMDDGFLGRHVFVESLSRLPMRNWEKPDDDAPPAALVESMVTIKSSHDEWNAGLPPIGSSKDGTPLFMYQPQKMPDAGATEEIKAFAESCDARRRDHKEGDIPAPLLGRAAEYAKRVAMCLAVLSNPHTVTPSVNATHAQLGIRVVQASMETLAKSMDKYGAESAHEADRKRVVSALKEIKNEDGWVRQYELVRKVRHITPKEIGVVLQRLQEEGVLHAKEAPKTRGGRSSVLLKLVA